MKTWLKNARPLLLSAALISLGVVLGGCGGGDDGGGDSGFAGFSIPQVPTARPSLTGMPSAINATGGDSTGNTGGAGGNLFVRATQGRLLGNDGRGRAGINANFVTAPVLADNIVTYAELIAIMPAQVTFGGNNEAFIDLPAGQDFFIPGTAVLNISDAPGGVDIVVIRANAAGDYIRIDGNINGVRLTLDSVGFGAVNELSTGVAVGIYGNVDLSGYPSPVIYSGGDFFLAAYSGAVVQTGTVNTSGNSPGAANAGAGGDVTLIADGGDVIIPLGILDVSGGDGVTAGNSGQINIATNSATMMNFPWGARANGGTGNAQGGTGGLIVIDHNGPLDMFLAFEARGGNSVGGPGPGVGLTIQGLTTQGVVTGTADGGDGASGADAGNISVNGSNTFGLAVEVTARGGDGATTNGGRGGNITVYCDGELFVNILVDAQNQGGSGVTNGGQGGSLSIGGFGETRNVTATGNNSGGASTTATGGTGGTNAVNMSSSFGESITASTYTLTSNGGNGVTGGTGGPAGLNLGGGINSLTLNLTANGGASTTSVGANAGTLAINLGTAVSLNLNLTATMNGGTTQSGNAGGRGGLITFNGTTSSANEVTLTGGPITLNGGRNNGAAVGGVSGRFGVALATGSIFTSNNVNYVIRGGSSASGTGGAGSSGATGGPAFGISIVNLGQVFLNGGSVDGRGGDGSTTSGTSIGGVGGLAVISTQAGRVVVGTPLDFSGGAGGIAGAGPGGDGGSISVDGESEVIISSNLTVDGAAGTIGGSGGFVGLTGTAPTRFVISSTVSANGGVGSGMGGNGGTINVGSGVEATVRFTSTAVVRASGGATTGNAGNIDIDLIGTGTSGITEDTGSQLLTNDGTGAAVPANIDRNTN